MKACIEVPNELLVSRNPGLDTEHLTELAGLDRDEGTALTVSVGGGNDFLRNVVTYRFDGPDEVVRPIVTYLMNFIHHAR